MCFISLCESVKYRFDAEESYKGKKQGKAQDGFHKVPRFTRSEKNSNTDDVDYR